MNEVEVLGDPSKVYIGGKSQGAFLSLYMQLMKLEVPLGGIILFASYPILPLRQLSTLPQEIAL